jgi:hypothetical protein
LFAAVLFESDQSKPFTFKSVSEAPIGAWVDDFKCSEIAVHATQTSLHHDETELLESGSGLWETNENEDERWVLLKSKENGRAIGRIPFRIVVAGWTDRETADLGRQFGEAKTFTIEVPCEKFGTAITRVRFAFVSFLSLFFQCLQSHQQGRRWIEKEFCFHDMFQFLQMPWFRNIKKIIVDYVYFSPTDADQLAEAAGAMVKAFDTAGEQDDTGLGDFVPKHLMQNLTLAMSLSVQFGFRSLVRMHGGSPRMDTRHDLNEEMNQNGEPENPP